MIDNRQTSDMIDTPNKQRGEQRMLNIIRCASRRHRIGALNRMNTLKQREKRVAAFVGVG
jgi:hypothetical protein